MTTQAENNHPHDGSDDDPIVLSRRLAIGSLLAGAALLPAAKVNAACSPTPSTTRTKNVKIDFCAAGDGATDDTAAIQAAVNSGESLYFPPGEYIISDTIVLPLAWDVLYAGSGKRTTRIKQITAGKDAFFHDHNFFRISWRDLSIIGVPNSGHGIRATGLIYTCDFTEVWFYTGGSGIYSVNNDVYSTLFSRCDFSSYNAHGIEIVGGNTCTFLQCYAWYLPADKYGYRVYGQALMLGCNGVNIDTNGVSGGWGLFGASTGDGDVMNREYQLTCINCNVEDHSTNGIRLKSNGWANIINTTFLSRHSGTFDAHLRIDYCNRLVELNNCAFINRGATLSSGRSHVISSPNAANIKAINSGETHYQMRNNGQDYTVELATERVEYAHWTFKLATTMNLLKAGGLAVTGPTLSIVDALVLGKDTASSSVISSTTPVAGYLKATLNENPILIPYYNAP